MENTISNLDIGNVYTRAFSPFVFNPFFAAIARTERPITGTDLAFRIITTEVDLNRAFEIRHDVFCKEMKVIDPDSFPNGREMDDYDANSLHTAIMKNGEMLAYARLVLPCNKFPLERTNILPMQFERARSVEISRGLVVKHSRHTDVTWHMFNSVYALCQENNMDALLSFSNAIMFNGFKRRNVPFRYVGEPVLFHGHKSFPLIIPINTQIPANFLH